MAQSLKRYGDVLVVAPNVHRSATSQAIDFINHGKERITFVKEEDDIKYYAHPDYPTDSLLYVLDYFDFKPDLVVSGINIGTNIGDDVYYSGTVGIATAAALAKIDNFALSIDKNYKDTDLKKLDEVVDYIIKNKFYHKDYVLNVNLPLNTSEINYQFCPLFSKFNDKYYLEKGYVTLTPIVLDRTDFKRLEILKKKI